MRETKFRAVTLPIYGRVKWVYGDYFSQDKAGVTSHYIVERPNVREAGRDVLWLVNPDTVDEYDNPDLLSPNTEKNDAEV